MAKNEEQRVLARMVTFDEKTKQKSNEEDITVLVNAVARLCRSWRDDKETFSVAVMGAVGAIIREGEAVIDIPEGKRK